MARTIWTMLFLIAAAIALPAYAANEDHVKDIAGKYDLVGVVTHTTMLKWNKNKNSKEGGRMVEVDPDKVPGGALYVGLGKDNDPAYPYFGNIFVKGRLYGYNELFIRVDKVTGQELRAMDDGGNEFLIKIIRRGSGYKRR